MKKYPPKRLLSLLLALAMLLGFAVPVSAAPAAANVTWTQVENSEVTAGLRPRTAEDPVDVQQYADDEVVRVSIVLEETSTVGAGYATADIARNQQAMAYRAGLRERQTAVTAAIEQKLGQTMDVVWNLTLAANIISANVMYGQIRTIEQVDGVAQILIETRYEPDVVSRAETADPHMGTSTGQIGSAAAWAAGFTGAGSRVAIIDSGIDPEHQSFSEAAFRYALAYRAGERGQSIASYMESLDLLDAEEIASVAGLLNAPVDPERAYIHAKLPFGYNYIDGDHDVSHLNDTQGEHGSHVAGIAAANAYIYDEGKFLHALDAVLVQGVAPDAQILTMKVFGKNGGAYDADYMAAIEDAILLGCDAVNLSLGSGNPGRSRSAVDAYQAILDDLTKSGAVITMSAGNSGSWVENAHNAGYLYAGDVSMQTNGSPGSYTNSLAVASVDNDGVTGTYILVQDHMIVYNPAVSTDAAPLTSLAGEQAYVFIDGIGTEEDWAAVGEALVGKIALCSRGTTSFTEKAQAAVAAGAIATLIYNNTDGIINMDLSDYHQTAPAASLTQADGARVKASSTPVTDAEGNVLYYTGNMTVSAGVGNTQYNSQFYTMSDFSSWGVPGSLELKPEITAPGGSIYSVYGTTPTGGGSDQYEVMSGTSMASPQVAGMVAVMAQYIRENDLETSTGLSARQLAQSLLMSTAAPVVEEATGLYYPVMRQGAGLANIGAAITADSYVLMEEDATDSWADGKVKAELGDDPQRTGQYTFSFTLHNLTDTEKAYGLSAAFFTQDIFRDHANDTAAPEELADYMDTRTTTLAAEVTWTADGKPVEPTGKADGLDFNGDGSVNAQDGQTLLEYVVGLSGAIQARERADLDGDGDVDTYDVYLFFRELSSGVALIPANGAVTITVTARVTEAQKTQLDERYPNGAYVEGFVFADSLADREGVAGTSHSIPVLGFYGKWSDPSMFDVGTYLEYASGDEFRTPYLGDPNGNAMTITYAGDPGNSYYFGGNPLILDATYMPERNAINSRDQLNKVYFISIRNAAASRFAVENLTTGVTMTETLLGAVDSAYYYTNGAVWYNTGWNLTAGFKPANAREGDVLEARMMLATEYDTDSEGGVNWAELGTGATFAIPMVVDDTAPKIEHIELDLINNTLTVKARDERYVAAVALYNKSGSKLYTYTGALQEIEPNATGEYVLDLADVNGRKFLLQVTDYAMNTATYAIETQIGEPVDYSGRMFGFTQGNYSIDGTYDRWIEIDPQTLYFYSATDRGGIQDFVTSELTVIAAEYVGGYVFMAADDGNIYVAEHEDLGYYQKVCSYGELNIVAMAMNYADGKLYLMTQSTDYAVAEMGIYTLDVLTGELAWQYDLSITHPSMNFRPYNMLDGLAIDDQGNFYAVSYGSSYSTYLFSWTNADAVDGKITGLTPNGRTYVGFYGYFASLAWDHDKDILYMAAHQNMSSSGFNYLLTLDPATGTGTKVSAYDGGHNGYSYASQLNLGVTGLYVVPSAQYDIGSVDGPTSVVLNRTDLELLKNATVGLTAEVYPWSLEDKSVTWSSTDGSVAVVDDYGMVTAVGVGTAKILATTNATPAIYAECTVTVDELDQIQLSGLVYDPDGDTYWSDFVTDELPAWTAVSGRSDAYLSGALVDETIIVHDGSAMYGVDADTFATVNYGPIASDWLWSDAAPFPSLVEGMPDMLVGLSYYGGLLELIDPVSGALSYFDLSGSGDPMAVIAYWKTDAYSVYTGNYYFILTEGGQLWMYIIYSPNGEDYSLGRADLGNTGLTLTGVSAVTGGQYASMFLDETTGHLLISTYLNGNSNALWAVDPEVLIPARLGDFGENVWPVVALYQYQRATELEVRLKPESAKIYEGETVALSAKVVVGETGQVTWSTSDASVATVDQNGLVTGVGDGTAIITATSVDTNANGQTVSDSATIQVTGLVDVDTQVNAQITTVNGSEWVSVNTTSMAATINGNAKTTFTGAGFGGDAIYGTNSDFVYGSVCNVFRVDPVTFQETKGSNCSSDYAILDLVNVPAMTFTATDANGDTVEKEAFGMPLYIANSQALLFLLDYAEGELTGWNTLYYEYDDLAAIAYIGDTTDYYGEPAKAFMLLGADGTLYYFTITPSYDKWDDVVEYNLSRATFGDLGITFDNYQALSMAYDGNGLIIADSSKGYADLYYAALTADGVTCGKIGRMPEATGITGLYTDGQMTNALQIPAETMAETIAATQVNITDTLQREEEAYSLSGTGVLAMGLTERNGAEQAAPNSDAAPAPNENAVTVNITTEVATTNGLTTVIWDTTKLALENVALSGTYTASVEKSGSLTFGYVSMTELPAGSTIATLTFKVLQAEESAITVEHRQVNNVAGTTETIPVEFQHKNTELRYAVEPTCTTAGYTGDLYCKDCGQLLEKGELIQATGHSYGEWKTSKPATCTESGEETRACANCDTKETRVIPATGHSFGEWTVTKAAACTEEGVETRTCACGETETRAIPATGHSFGEWTVTVPATCTEEGIETRTCACGETETRTIAAHGHDALSVIVAPTCTAEGYTEHTCQVCGESWRDTIVEALGHDYEAVVTAPTCTEAGYTTYTCAVCGDTYVADEVPATGHTFGEWTVTVPATCTEDGEETRTCACGETETRAIPAYCPTADYTDVPLDAWYHEAVDYVVANGIMEGTAEGIFQPNGTTTRAQLVTVLYRLEGEPEVELTEQFTDVAADAWYAEAVAWAYAEGITTGVTETAFAPNAAVTREQVVVFLARYAEHKGIDTASEYELSEFADADVVQEYAVPAFRWAVENGIINGIDGYLAPAATSTRAQIATILMRYCAQ